MLSCLFIGARLNGDTKKYIVPPEQKINAKRDTKEEVAAKISHKEIKGKNYTIKVGLWGSRKIIPTITGITKRDRAVQFLEIEWGIGNMIYAFTEGESEYWIDYTLPICIGWADSHLTKASKSKNNIGNVGNNDRGDTKEYDTLEKWIEDIFAQLKYGTYMKGHSIIGTLSGEWRKIMWIEGCLENGIIDKKCYATSEGVWSTNVTNCMSVLHNEQVDVWTQFRV